MPHLPRRTLRPQSPGPRAAGRTWIEAFTHYAAGECHLSVNTVEAYRRDLVRFFQWFDGRVEPQIGRAHV